MTQDPNPHDFKLERLKFVLQQIDRSNERFHKYMTFFQGIAVAIVGAGAAVFASWNRLGLSIDASRALIRGLEGLLVIIAGFVCVSVLAGIASWIDYRREEVRLLGEVVRHGYRKPPSLRNVWRWHETYLLAFLILTVTVMIVFVESIIVPLIC